MTSCSARPRKPPPETSSSSSASWRTIATYSATAFPWLVSGENDRPFCQAATERGILLAPGDCFDAPSHFRLGFAAAGDNFSKALDRFGAFVKSWSAKMVTA